MGLAEREYTRRDYEYMKRIGVRRRLKLHISQAYDKLKRWFCRREQPYRKLRLDILFRNLSMATGLALVLLIVVFYSDILNTVAIGFIELGTFCALLLLYFILKSLYNVFVHVKRTVKSLSNGAKLFMVLLLFVLSLQVCQLQNNVSLSDSLALEHYFNTSSATETGTGISYDTELGSERLEECEKLIFDMTNAERRAQGLPELTFDPLLANVAREHSVDMAQNDFFSHTNLKGEDPTDRVRRHGLTLIKRTDEGMFIVGIAENIGMMPKGNLIEMGYAANEPEGLATAQVQSWLNSSKHRANILNPHFEKLGVGVAYNGHYYVSTQNFQ